MSIPPAQTLLPFPRDPARTKATDMPSTPKTPHELSERRWISIRRRVGQAFQPTVGAVIFIAALFAIVSWADGWVETALLCLSILVEYQ